MPHGAKSENLCFGAVNIVKNPPLITSSRLSMHIHILVLGISKTWNHTFLIIFYFITKNILYG